MADEAKTFMIEGAKLLFRNFEGREGQYNVKGDRNFAVILPEDLAEKLAKDGWNVKLLAARDEGDVEEPYLTVKVNFENRPPRVVLISSTARTHLTESMVEILDGVDIENCDLICRGYDWSVNGKNGTKAYLQSMYIIQAEDDLDRKYAIRDEDGG